MVLPRDKWARSALLLTMSQLMLVTTAVAETRTTDDYIAITVEAEDHSSVDDRWILTEPNTPAQDNDPDPNHSDGAIGNAYLELLPDIRVTHDDPFGPPTAIWNQRGAGPRASYPLDFPEAGRYYVHIRAFSTGTEDNGIHVGLNNDFPLSGARMQFCTAGQGWAWSGRQRDSGAAGPCGARKTIWVTVEEPGINTFMISAREDGFEADRIMLIKDLSDNTRICSPSGADDINCVNGSLENVDGVLDLNVEIEIENTQIDIEEEVPVTMVVRNLDRYDIAEEVVLSLDLDLDTQWSAVSVDDLCEVVDTSIVCNLGEVVPSGPEFERILDFTLQPLRSGALTIPALVETISIDDAPDNDAISATVEVFDEGSLSQLAVRWAALSSRWEVEAETNVTLIVESTGVGDADQVGIRVSVPSGLSITTVPSECVGAGSLQCTIETLAVGDRAVLMFGVTPARAGFYSLAAIADAANLDGDDVSQSFILEAFEVEELPEEEIPEELPVDETPDTETPDSSEAVSGVTSRSSSGSVGVWLFMLLAITLLNRSYVLSQARRIRQAIR